MRAYMSDPNNHLWRHMGNLPNWDQRYAYEEAFRILARTETGNRPTCDHAPKRLRNPHSGGRLVPTSKVRSLPVYQDVKWEAARALAESLGRLVSLDASQWAHEMEVR